jgi:hypothetical protein
VNEDIGDDVQAHGISENTNEAIVEDDDVEAHGIQSNTNEDGEDDVEAHGIRENTNEAIVEDDERARLAGNDNEDAAEDE